MRKLMFSGVAAGLVGGAMLLSGGAPLSAATLPSPAVATPGETTMVDKVQYDYGRYGSRYGYSRYPYRYGGYSRYGGYGPSFGYGGYGGYGSGFGYAPSVGFGVTVPGATFGLTTPGVGGSSAHVQWCADRYRTYDPASDTYIPRVGERARCNSPYN